MADINDWIDARVPIIEPNPRHSDSSAFTNIRRITINELLFAFV